MLAAAVLVIVSETALNIHHQIPAFWTQFSCLTENSSTWLNRLLITVLACTYESEKTLWIPHICCFFVQGLESIIKERNKNKWSTETIEQDHWNYIFSLDYLLSKLIKQSVSAYPSRYWLRQTGSWRLHLKGGSQIHHMQMSTGHSEVLRGLSELLDCRVRWYQLLSSHLWCMHQRSQTGGLLDRPVKQVEGSRGIKSIVRRPNMLSQTS